jgi:enoyl-[acyl-carrier protein] reductase I
VSSYSFAALAKAGRSMLKPGSSLLAMSYLGAVRVAPHYNVMGLAKASLEANVRYMAATLGPEQIRVNAISPGPIKTLSAKGVGDFNRLLDYGERNSPLRGATSPSMKWATAPPSSARISPPASPAKCSM